MDGMNPKPNNRSAAINLLAFTMLFTGYFFTTGTALIESSAVKEIFRFFALILFFWNIVLERTVSAEILTSLFFVVILYLINQSGFALNIIFLLVTAASMYRLSKRELAKVLLIPSLIVVFLHVILLSSGRISSQVYEVTDRARSTLGFANSNQVSIIYLSVAVLSAYAHTQFRSKASACVLAAALAISFIVFGMTDTRTAMFSLFILIAFTTLSYFFGRFKYYKNYLTMTATSLPLVASVATYYLATGVNPDVDILLSLRPTLFSSFVADVTLFDIIFGWPSESGVDNLFLTLLSGVGIVGYVAIITFICIRLFKADKSICHLTIVLITASVFESFLIRPEIPMSALFVQILFSRNRVATPG